MPLHSRKIAAGPSQIDILAIASQLCMGWWLASTDFGGPGSEVGSERLPAARSKAVGMKKGEPGEGFLAEMP